MCIRNFLSLICQCLSICTKTLYQFVKNSFVAPSVSIIKNSNIFQKKLSLSENLWSKQLFTIDFHIVTKSILSHNKKSLQKSFYFQQDSYLHWQGIAIYLYSQLMKLLLIPCNMSYPRKNLICLKQVYTSQSNQIKFENPKSSLP